MKRNSVLFLCATLLLAACGPAGPNLDVTITPDANRPATETALPPTAQPTLTLPAPTSSPAPTRTPAPTSLNTAGPYVLYGGDKGIWISNPDGSFATRLVEYDERLYTDLHRLISPMGDRLAVIVRNDEGLDLVEVKIPSGETHTIAHLLGLTRDELFTNPTSEQAIVDYAIVNFDTIAWQPGEGRLLAFMGAVNGTSSDLYTYDTQSGEITQLTNGPSQGVFPNWSPDGKYILHSGVSWHGPFEGVIPVHNDLNGTWAVRVADGEVITQPLPKGGYFDFVGWQDETHYITYDSNQNCSQNLRSVDLVTGKATSIMDWSFASIVRSPENGAFLFTTPAVFSGSSECANSPGAGTYILLPGETTPTQVDHQEAMEVDWMPESKVFSTFRVNNPYPVTIFSSDGKTQYEVPAPSASFVPAISQKGYQAWVVKKTTQGDVEVKVPGRDWKTIFDIFDGSATDVMWDPVSGDTLLIIGEDGAIYAAAFPYFTPKRIGYIGRYLQVIWVP